MRGKASVVIACVIVVGVPLAFDPGGYFVFLPIKWTIATAAVFAGLAALVLEHGELPRPPGFVAWVVLLAVLVVSSLIGVGGLTSWIGYPGRYLGVLAWLTFFGAFLLGTSLSDKRELVVRVGSMAPVGVSLYALAQAIGVDPIRWAENIDISRTRSTFGNAAFLGSYLALIVPISTGLALKTSDPPRWRILHAVSAIVGSVALLTTQTRGAWLGALVGLVVVGATAVPHASRRTAATVAAGAAVLLVVLATVSPYGARIRSVVDPTAGTGRGRIVQWERTLHLVEARPIIGWGSDTYAIVFPHYIDARFERTVGRDVVPDRAHNVILDIMASSGVLGLLAFAAIIVVFARRVVSDRNAVTVAIAGGCVAYVVQLQFSFSLADVDVVFWFLAGLAVATGDVPRRPHSRAWAVVPALLAAAVVVWGATDAVADRMLRSALESEARGDLDHARDAVDRAASLAWSRAQYDQAAARLHMRIGVSTRTPDDFGQALDLLARARRLVPGDPELAMDRADVLLAWGEVTGDRSFTVEAKEGFEKILGYDKASSRAHLRLGVAEAELGRLAAAEQDWRLAASLAPHSPGPIENLARLYEREGRHDEARRMREKLRGFDR